MKKIVSFLLIALLLFSFVACASNGSDENTTTAAAEENSDMPIVSLRSDKTEVSAGDIISVYVHIKNAKHTACFDIFLYADEKLDYEIAASQIANTELILAANYLDGEDEGYVAIRGIVATAFDLLDNDIYRIDYKVSDKVQSGDKLNFNLQVPSFELALDASGNDIFAVNEYLQTNNLTVSVK